MRRVRQSVGGVPLHRVSCIAAILLLMVCLKQLYLIAGGSLGKSCETPSGTQSLSPAGQGFQSPLISEGM